MYALVSSKHAPGVQDIKTAEPTAIKKAEKK
jgi:hypothetical protein